MAKTTDLGDGDTCPLFPQHGNMYVLQGSDPPKQWCAHAEHAGRPGPDGPPPSRSGWPLYGLEDSVRTYIARLDHAIAKADLPDLSTLEVL